MGKSHLLHRLAERIRRRPFRALVWLLIGLFLITPLIIVTRTWFVIHASTLPSGHAGDTYPDVQTEGFTCGVHAIHAVYRAYGMDPAAERVRWRLGVDTKAVFWMRDSTGALHPDMFMVLRQDGFEVHSVPLGTPRSHQQILDHLASGHMLLLLIQRRENGNLHWVAAKDSVDEGYVVYDSLLPEPYHETRSFTDHHVLTALAVSPSGRLKTGFRESLDHLADGTAELTRFQKRFTERKPDP